MTNEEKRVLMDILADYLRLVGNDPDRKTRINVALKVLAKWTSEGGKTKVLSKQP